MKDDGLLVSPARRAELLAWASRLPSCPLDETGCAELELLLTGALGPLDRYLDRDEHAAALRRGRLDDGTVCPLPLSLPVPAELASSLARDDRVVLRDPEGVPLAVVIVRDVYRAGDGELWQLGGAVQGIDLPTHHDFTALRHREGPADRTWQHDPEGPPAVYFTSSPLHRPRLAALAAAADGSRLLVLSPVGGATATDLRHHVLVRCLEAAVAAVSAPGARLALSPLPAERSPGWRGVVLRALVARSYGSRRLLVDREDLNDARAAADTAEVAFDELLTAVGVDVEILPPTAYAPSADRFLPVTTAAPRDLRVETDVEIERLFAAGADVPKHLVIPRVVAELERLRPSPQRRGLTVFFTGLSGSGKSTVANVLAIRLLELGRRVTLLDGDVVRHNLSAGLGFSREDRDRNVRRIGFVAAEISHHGGTVVCAPIAPYDDARKAVRQAVEAGGSRFVLVHVATPLEVCESRDRKGLYAKARAGLLPAFTGVTDPYENPDDADVVIDTQVMDGREAAESVVTLLAAEGLVAPAGDAR